MLTAGAPSDNNNVDNDDDDDEPCCTDNNDMYEYKNVSYQKRNPHQHC